MFDEVDWSERGSYMVERHGVTPSMADEALRDFAAQVFDPDPKSRSARTTRIIGFSKSAGVVLTIIVLHKTTSGAWWGVNGWPSNGTERRIYRERSRDGSDF